MYIFNLQREDNLSIKDKMPSHQCIQCLEGLLCVPGSCGHSCLRVLTSTMYLRTQIFIIVYCLSARHCTFRTNCSECVYHSKFHCTPRFLCSRSGRVYLHKDIRLIFARRAPDTEPDFSRVTLTTVTEAPPSPKYGPLDGQSSDRIKLAGVIRF